MEKVLRKTYSVCPVCLKRIPARHVQKDPEGRGNAGIYMEKTCPEHGDFSTVLWRGFLSMDEWRGGLPEIQDGENENCPHACGLCPEHQRDTCCILLEVTKQCNLSCTYCFAEGGTGDDIPFEKIVEDLNDLAVPGQTLVQLSGGEPTVRDDLPLIVKAAKDAGCAYVQLNSNGIRLGEDEEYVKALAEAGLSFVFMQFDGLDDEIYKTLRGRELFEIKEKVIENCDKYNIGVTLVPTIVPGVNVSEIGDIIRYGLSKSPAVRGIHFQPVSYFGRTPELGPGKTTDIAGGLRTDLPHGSAGARAMALPTNQDRFTLDELINEIQLQAGDLVSADTLIPSACDHPLCGFHGDYIAMSDGKLYPLKKSGGDSCCCGDTKDKSGGTERTGGAVRNATAEQNRLFVARRWERQATASGLEAGPDGDGIGKHSAADPETGQAVPEAGDNDGIETLEGFLKRVKSHSFTITAMAFQDAGNLDLERLRRCSLHVYNEGKIVPFCANYLSPFC